jgi:tRNA(Ile)-lysidine synthetase-like protein
MSRFSPSELLVSLESRLALPHDAAVCIAFSGGLDSTVLLHAVARLATEQRSYRLRAAHVDHALHSDSARWREHCERQARALHVDLVTARVNVERVDELGLEAAAREARYSAFRQMLHPGEYLLSAHHADDQLETLLLALKHYDWAPVNRVFGLCHYWCLSRLPRPLAGLRPLVLLATILYTPVRYMSLNRGLRRADLQLLTTANFRKIFKTRTEILQG